jgi:hypothetical protein
MPIHTYATLEDHHASEPTVKRITLHGNAVNAAHTGATIQRMDIRVVSVGQ